jgi:hypothetical protein
MTPLGIVLEATFCLYLKMDLDIIVQQLTFVVRDVPRQVCLVYSDPKPMASAFPRGRWLEGGSPSTAMRNRMGNGSDTGIFSRAL